MIILDQSQTIQNTYTDFFAYAAQSFIAGISGNIDHISILIAYAQSAPGRCFICNDSSDTPNFSSAITNYYTLTLTGTLTWTDITFTTIPTLTSGTKYWIVVQQTLGGFNNLRWGRNSAGGYNAGKGLTQNGDVIGDFCFSTYIVVNNVVKINIADTWKNVVPGTLTASSSASYNYYNPISTGTSGSNGQSFTPGATCTLDSAKFFLLRTANALTGSAYAKIYAHTGTYGTSSLPTGVALATSDAFAVSALTTSAALYTFSFSGANRIALTTGTYYVVQLEYAGGDGSNYIRNAFYSGSSVHPGNGNYNKITTTADDMRFYVYGTSNAVQKINIGNVWKPIVSQKINIGDTWKEIF